MTAVDNFTSTVDGAAGFERHYGRSYDYDDRPSLSDLAEDSGPSEWFEQVMEDGPPEDPGPVQHLYGAPQEITDRECRSPHRELRLTGNGTDRCDACWAEATAEADLARLELEP